MPSDAEDPPVPDNRSIETRILDAAEDLFLAHGYHATSTDMIQAAADVSKSTLYRFFRTKKLLFESALSERGRKFLALIGRYSEEQNLEVFLHELGFEFLRALLEPGSLAAYRIMIMESQKFPETGMAFYQGGPKGVVDLLDRYFIGAIARGEIKMRDTRVGAEQFVGLIRGEIYLRVLLGVEKRPSKSKMRKHVNETVSTFLHGIGVAAEDTGARNGSDRELS